MTTRSKRHHPLKYGLQERSKLEQPTLAYVGRRLFSWRSVQAVLPVDNPKSSKHAFRNIRSILSNNITVI